MSYSYKGWKRLLAATAVGLLAFAGTAAASSSYRTAFRTAYPAALNSRIDSCLLCHTTANVSSSARNVYGAAYGAANHNFKTVEGVDTDSDGFTNLAEITQFFFPGNPGDYPAAALPTVTIAATDAIATETGLTTGQYTVTRTGVTTAALTVNYAVGGTATAGSDYATLAGSIQLPVGAATATVTVTPVDDLLVEADETVVATLSANAVYTVGAASSASVTIQSNDAAALPTVTIVATDAIATEIGLTTGQYTVTRTGVTTAALTVNYTVGGTATAGSDYATLAGSVQLPAGAATAAITVTPVDDLLVEVDETVVATLGANAAYLVGAAASASVTIQSDDFVALPTVTIVATDALATEAGLTTGQYTVTRTGVTTAALNVNYTVAGTAAAGSDYGALSGSLQVPAGAATATITVTPIDDLLVEADETVVATLSANSAYTVGAAASATVTIQSDEVTTLPTVTVVATDALATEAGLTTGQYTVTRTGATIAALTVRYTVAGTAAAGSDYTALTGSVQVPAGAATAAITVTPIDDLLVESDETVVISLSANAAYLLGAAASATVAIQSNDVPTVTIVATDPLATEAGLTTGQYTVTRTGATNAALTIIYSVAGTAAAGSDYTALTGSVQVPAGAATAAITVTPIDDLLVEADEMVVTSLSANAAYLVGAAASATVTIRSDDVVPVMTLTVASTSPSGGMSIAVSPNDNNNVGAGSTQFTRTYDQGVQVTLTAASSFGGAEFSDWSGCASASGNVCLVTMDASATVTANYAAASAYALWTRGDTRQAALWKIGAGVGATGVMPTRSWRFVLPAAETSGPWEATSYQQVSATEGYLLWARRDTGQAALAQINPSVDTREIPLTSWAYLKTPAGIGGPWEATSYQHISASEGHVLWTRADTGQAAVWKIDPRAGAVTHVIPTVSWGFLYSTSGVGGPWQATSYRYVSYTEAYVLWTRSDTGQAGMWKIDPSTGTRVIPVTEYLYSSPRVGGPWQASSYEHVSATEGYLLWTRSDTGQAMLWKIDPSSGAGFGRVQPDTDTAYLKQVSGVGAPWHATSYMLAGVNGARAAAIATASSAPQAVTVLKSGSGAGTITFRGANCGPACPSVTLPDFARETVVVTAAAGSWFVGWETADGVGIDILQAQPGETVHALFEQY